MEISVQIRTFTRLLTCRYDETSKYGVEHLPERKNQISIAGPDFDAQHTRAGKANHLNQ